MLIIKLVLYNKQHSHNLLFANDNLRDEFLLIIVAVLVFFWIAEYTYSILLAAPFYIYFELAGN